MIELTMMTTTSAAAQRKIIAIAFSVMHPTTDRTFTTFIHFAFQWKTKWQTLRHQTVVHRFVVASRWEIRISKKTFPQLFTWHVMTLLDRLLCHFSITYLSEHDQTKTWFNSISMFEYTISSLLLVLLLTQFRVLNFFHRLVSQSANHPCQLYNFGASFSKALKRLDSSDVAATCRGWRMHVARDASARFRNVAN